MTRLLVTGFGPFPRMPRNPSGDAALALAAAPRLRLLGIAAHATILTTAYATLPGELDRLLAAEPDAVLMLGVAGRARRVRVETRATSGRSTLVPDVSGDRPGQIRPMAVQSVRRATADAGFALLQLRAQGMPARLSRDPGRYLCNAAYFRALGGVAPTLFIHIPKVPRSRPVREGGPRRVGARWRKTLTAALVDIAIGMRRPMGQKPSRREPSGPSNRVAARACLN